MSAPPTAGAYLRLRREAAGLSHADAGELMSATGVWKYFNARALDSLEHDMWFPTTSFIDRIRRAFRFDRYVYRQLLMNLQPVPPICRACGCSDLDPCDDEHHGPCAWASPTRDLCTQCQRAQLGAEEAA